MKREQKATPLGVFSLALLLATTGWAAIEPSMPVYDVGGEVQPPVRLSGSPPAYPEEAREARVEGVVNVQAVIDSDGRVVEVVPLDDGSDNELLRGAAVAAIRDWRFQPATLDGEPVAVHYRLTVRFDLDGPRPVDAFGSNQQAVYKVEGEVVRPERVSGDPPSYPPDSRKGKIQGRVVVEAVIDRQGDVAAARVVSAPAEDLGHAAAAAIKTWKFRPATLAGEPVPVYYNLTVNFRLSKDGP